MIAEEKNFCCYASASGTHGFSIAAERIHQSNIINLNVNVLCIQTYLYPNSTVKTITSHKYDMCKHAGRLTPRLQHQLAILSTYQNIKQCKAIETNILM